MVSHRAILEARAIHVPDLLATDDFPKATDLARRTGQRTSLAVPLLREGTPIGAILIRRTEVRPFTEPQVQLLQAFADQAAIAIENVRLFNETKSALQRQTAISEILHAIASSPGDEKPVLRTIAKSATRFCGADDVSVLLLSGEHLELAAHHGSVPVASDGTRIEIARDTLAGHAILDRRTVHIADALGPEGDKYPPARMGAEALGQRAMLATPLVRENRPIGAIVLRKMEPIAFTPDQIGLVEGSPIRPSSRSRMFASQRDERGARAADRDELDLECDYRSPTDVQPVLDAIVESGARLCHADMAFIYVVDEGLFKLRAGYKVPPAFVEYTNSNPVPVAPHRGSLSGRVVAERRAVQIPDVLADAEYTYLEGQRLVGYRSMLNVPMFSKGELIGLIGLWRTAPIAFTSKQIDLMSTFADQAVIAIENTRLFNETKEALERQTSISDVLQTIGRSAFDLHPVLDTVVERAVKLCDARDGSSSTLEDDVYRTRAFWSASSLPPAYIDFMRQEVRTPGAESRDGLPSMVVSSHRGRP